MKKIFFILCLFVSFSTLGQKTTREKEAIKREEDFKRDFDSGKLQIEEVISSGDGWELVKIRGCEFLKTPAKKIKGKQYYKFDHFPECSNKKHFKL